MTGEFGSLLADTSREMVEHTLIARHIRRVSTETGVVIFGPVNFAEAERWAPREAIDNHPQVLHAIKVAHARLDKICRLADLGPELDALLRAQIAAACAFAGYAHLIARIDTITRTVHFRPVTPAQLHMLTRKAGLVSCIEDPGSATIDGSS